MPKKPDNKSDGKSDNKSGDNGLDEWKAARDVFDKFDDRISDLRKFGFTFLSGLIAADALTKLFNAPDDRIRLGVVGITLLLTVALMVLDKNYQLFQFAAGIRAKILETRLNLELTETIAFRSNMYKFKDYVLAIYLAFASVAGLVGILLFYPKVTWLSATIIFTVISAIFIYFINMRQPNTERQVDWSFDRTTCELGEKIRITVTNLCDNPVSFPTGNPLWAIRKEGKDTYLFSELNPAGLTVLGQNNYTWEISTDNLDGPGIYRVHPAFVEGNGVEGLWQNPMKRAIIVEPKSD